jgi:hypothetical protein
MLLPRTTRPRLVELSESADATWTPAERRLLEHALYSTYRDCDGAGLTVVARAVLAEMRRG